MPVPVIKVTRCVCVQPYYNTAAVQVYIVSESGPDRGPHCTVSDLMKERDGWMQLMTGSWL